MIEVYFEKYGDNIFSFNYVQKTKTIHFWFKNTWEIPSNLIPSTMGVKKNKNEVDKGDNNRYYCILHNVLSTPSIENEMVEHKPASFDEMFEVLSAVFEYNIEKERKQVLLQEKINQLQKTFAELSLDDLKKMDFK